VVWFAYKIFRSCKEGQCLSPPSNSLLGLRGLALHNGKQFIFTIIQHRFMTLTRGQLGQAKRGKTHGGPYVRLIGHSKGDCTENKFRKCPGGPHRRFPGRLACFGLYLGLGSQSMPGVPGMSVFSRGTVFICTLHQSAPTCNERLVLHKKMLMYT